MPRRPPRRPTDRWKGTKPSFFRVRPPTPDVASTMFAILAIFFSAPSQPLERTGERGVAHPNPGHAREELAPLGQRGRRALPEVRLQEPYRSFIHLRLRTGTLLGDQRAALACGGGVALDGRDAHSEGAGDLRSGRATLLGLDDLLPQVQRVCVHAHILPCRPTTLQGALERI